MHGAARASARDEAGPEALTAPSFGSILARGLPGFVREGFLPLGAFYVGWKLGGTVAGIGASTATALALYVHERRADRDGLVVRLSLGFVLVRSTIGLVTGSATAYLATPVVANAVWAAIFIGSAAVGRPVVGALACAWYPFTPSFRTSPAFRRVYGVESVVWGVYLLARAGLRLAVLLQGGVGGFVVVTFVTGAPVLLALLAWSVWYAMRAFADEPAAAPATR